VVPRGRPDGSVEVEIETVASERVSRDQVAYTSTGTRVAIRPGETLVLSAVDGSSARSGTDLLGAGVESSADETATLLRVDRVDGEGDASPASSGRSP
jgi:hypothetical protein